MKNELIEEIVVTDFIYRFYESLNTKFYDKLASKEAARLLDLIYLFELKN